MTHQTRIGATLTLALLAGLPAVAGRARPADPPPAYSTYLGGSDADEGTAIAVDAAGNAYVAGSTLSPDFPVVAPGAGPIPHDPDFPRDVFVTKLAPDGSAVWSTYGGTEWDDWVGGIAVDAQGRIAVAGWVDTGGDIQVLLGEVRADGGHTDFNIPFAGASLNEAYGIALSPGATVLAGISNADFGDPHPPGESSHNGFVARLTAAGIQGSYFAGDCQATPRGVAADAGGFIYLTGFTSCPGFPLRRPAQGTLGGGSDAFVMKLDPVDLSIVYSTFLGGGADDGGSGIAVDLQGNAYVTGSTASIDFPVRRPLQGAAGGRGDMFLTKLDPTGAIVYSTYLGGSGWDQANGIAVDRKRAVYLTGFSDSADFPPIEPGCPATARGGAFVIKLDPTGKRIVYSTFAAGGDAIAVDPAGNSTVTGTTSTGLAPVHAFQPTYGGGFTDAYAIRIFKDHGEGRRCGGGKALSAPLGGER
jgi:hypothetical protein